MHRLCHRNMASQQHTGCITETRCLKNPLAVLQRHRVSQKCMGVILKTTHLTEIHEHLPVLFRVDFPRIRSLVIWTYGALELGVIGCVVRSPAGLVPGREVLLS